MLLLLLLLLVIVITIVMRSRARAAGLQRWQRMTGMSDAAPGARSADFTGWSIIVPPFAACP